MKKYLDKPPERRLAITFHDDVPESSRNQITDDLERDSAVKSVRQYKTYWNMFRCDDCDKENPPMFMLKDDVWVSIASKDVILCIDCANKRLGRNITLDDLKPSVPLTRELQLLKTLTETNRDASDAVEQIMEMLNQTSLFTQLQDMMLEEYEMIEENIYDIIDKWSKS